MNNIAHGAGFLGVSQTVWDGAGELFGPGSFEHAGYGGINIGFGATQVFWGYMWGYKVLVGGSRGGRISLAVGWGDHPQPVALVMLPLSEALVL